MKGGERERKGFHASMTGEQGKRKRALKEKAKGGGTSREGSTEKVGLVGGFWY